MSIEAGIIAYLETKASVTALTGSGSASRIRGGFLEEGDVKTGAAIVVTGGGNAPTMTMGGAQGISSATIFVDCFGQEYSDANGLANAVANVTSGLAKTVAGHSFIESCFVSNILDTPPDIMPEIQDLNIFGRRVELFIWLQDSIPTFV